MVDVAVKIATFDDFIVVDDTAIAALAMIHCVFLNHFLVLNEL